MPSTAERAAEVLYEICAACPFFIEPNAAADDEPGMCHARFVHLDNGEVDHDHDATPSGDARPLTRWLADRPELFPPDDTRYLAPTVLVPEGRTAREIQDELNDGERARLAAEVGA